jgi:rubrerythrin
MSVQLGPGAPTNSGEAFAYLQRLKDGATIDDLKVLALTEAIGQPLYEAMVQKTDNPEVQALLQRAGREELGHAHRVGKAIEMLTGEPFPIPALEDHPFYTPLETGPITKEVLLGIAEGEFAGEEMYRGVASGFDDPEVKKLFALNGGEERQHGERLHRIVELLYG